MMSEIPFDENAIGMESGLDRAKEQEKKEPIDALIVFGAGIQSDQDLENMKWAREEIEGDKLSSRRRLPLVAKLRTVAAAELFIDGQVKDVIITGGRVKSGEGVEESEAELMADYFEKIVKKRWSSELKKSKLATNADSSGEALNEEINREVEAKWELVKDRVKIEDKATNTIENFAHTVNFLDENQEKYQKIALLSNEFHIDRIIKIAKLLQVRGQGVAAEDVLNQTNEHYQRLIQNYFTLEGNSAYRQQLQEALSDEDWQTAQARMRGEYKGAVTGEVKWSRALDEIPEYWLANVRFVESLNRLRDILNAQEQIANVLAEKGVDDIEQASYEQLIDAISKVERKMPPADWEPKEVS